MKIQALAQKRFLLSVRRVAHKAPLGTAILFAILISAPSGAPGKEPIFGLELEAGPVWQSRNDVQIPNDPSGTRFSLYDFAGSGPWPAARLYVTLFPAARHSLRLLLAPLVARAEGPLGEPVEFAGGSFATDEPATATYRFNSWRLTYRYRMRETERFSWHLGFTAKIRDAKIQIDQSGSSARKTDVGFVPLLHLAACWRPGGRWQVLLDLDALAGGPGRAEDLCIKLAYDLREDTALAFGYRTVEGGADVDAVYNFAWLHYLVFSVKTRF